MRVGDVVEAKCRDDVWLCGCVLWQNLVRTCGFLYGEPVSMARVRNLTKQVVLAHKSIIHETGLCRRHFVRRKAVSEQFLLRLSWLSVRLDWIKELT